MSVTVKDIFVKLENPAPVEEETENEAIDAAEIGDNDSSESD